ncbi:MAG: O-antigen ligase family protein [Nitriliruptorales bacterium]|nr:O-antigen ligase family protein [Nitriliruptorales bacterium]
MLRGLTSSLTGRGERLLLSSALALVAWVGLGGPMVRQRLMLMVGLLGCIGTYLLARSIERRQPTLVHISVAVSPLVLSVTTRSGVSPEGPLPYANAAGALFFVAAGAALLLAIRSRTRVRRGAWTALFGVYAFVPWPMGSHAAAMLALTLPGAMWVTRGGGRHRRWLAASVGFLLVAIAFTIVLGTTYEPGERSGAVERVVDATLSERRVQLWADAVALMIDHPATGVGPGNFAEMSPTAIAHPDTAPVHSEFLQLGAETGLLGFVLGLLVAIAAILRWRRPGADAVVAATLVAGLALHASMDYVLHFAVVPLVAAAVTGAESARSASPAAPETSPLVVGGNRPWLAPTGLATLGVILLSLLPWGPLNPPVYGPNGAELRADGAVTFATPGLLHTLRPPVDVYEQIATTNELQVTMRVRAAMAIQTGPARIVSSSESTKRRNFTVGQDGGDLVVRIRTSSGDLNGTNNELRVPDILGDLEPHHIEIVVDDDVVTVHVDGRARAWRAPQPLELASWDASFPVLFGNELDHSRPWLGEVRDLVWRTPASRPPDPPDPTEQISSPTQLEIGPLVKPRASPGTPGTLAGTATDLSQHHPLLAWAGWRAAWSGQSFRVLRLLGTLALFGMWAGLVLTRHRRAMHAPVVVLGGAVVAALIEGAQFLQGRSPSLVDVAAALLGTLVGAWWAFRSSRQPARPLAHRRDPSGSRVPTATGRREPS